MDHDGASQDADFSLGEYARYYDLTTKHLEQDPLLNISSSGHDFEQLQERPELFQINESNGTLPTERMYIDANAMSFLAAVLQPPKGFASSMSDCLDSNIHHVRSMKHESPLLRTDHELDMQRFGKTIVPDFVNEYLPLEAIDVEVDEGLDWPSYYANYPGRIWDEIRNEKLAMSNADLAYLLKTLKWHEEDGANVSIEDDDAVPHYQRDTALIPITPPLLPLPPECAPFVPSSGTGHLDMLPELTSPLNQEIADAEKAVFQKDMFLPGSRSLASSPQPASALNRSLRSDSLGDIYNPLKGIDDDIPSPSLPRATALNCKVEVPLSPPESDQQVPWERQNVSFGETLKYAIPHLPSSVPTSQSNPEDEINKFFEQSIAPMAIKAERHVEQEQLQEADTTQRVTIPIMDFSRPRPPWDVYPSSTETANAPAFPKDILADLTPAYLKTKLWRATGKKDRELTWVAFPSSLAKVHMNEGIDDYETLTSFLERPACFSLEGLLWKRSGLRIFDDLEESDEEELQAGVFPDGKGLASLVLKRKLEIDDAISATTDCNNGSRTNGDHAPKRRQSLVTPGQALSGKQTPDIAPTRIDDDLLGAHIPALTALSRYIDARQIQTDPSTKAVKPSNTSCPLHTQHEIAAQAKRAQIIPETVPNPQTVTPTIAVPYINLPKEARQFVFSASLLSNRELSRRIIGLYPIAEIIERDWSIHFQSHQSHTGPNQNALAKNLAQPCSDEADVIISPSTGLIWTSLQKIKQRALPGQNRPSSKFDLQIRIASASSRYDNLFVLVGFDTKPTSTDNTLSTNDCNAVSDFGAFCSALPTSVSVIHVVGGEEELAKWIVALMIKHSLCIEVQLAQEESAEEVVLRKAGFNAYVAQVVLALADQVTNGRLRSPSPLCAFLSMSLEEKILHFESFAGRRNLERVHQICQMRW